MVPHYFSYFRSLVSSLSLIDSTPECHQIDLTLIILNFNLSVVLPLSSFISLISLSSLKSSDSSLFSSTVRDFGVALECPLTYIEHTSNLMSSSYSHLRRLRGVYRSVAFSISTKLVQGFICSQVDLCNSFLIGLPTGFLSVLVCTQHSYKIDSSPSSRVSTSRPIHLRNNIG